MSWYIKFIGTPAKVKAAVMADKNVPASVKLMIDDEIAALPGTFDGVIVSGNGHRGLGIGQLIVEPYQSADAADAAPAPAPAPAKVPEVLTESPAQAVPISIVSLGTKGSEDCPACHGFGSQILGSGVPCPSCHGTGKVKISVL